MKILSGVSPSAIRGLLGARPQNGETRGEALYSRIRDSVSESMHGRVARVRVRRRSKRRKKKEEKRSVCRTSAASIEESGANNLANCRQRIFKFEHRISLGPPARGHRVNQSGESSALVRVTKNRIRAFKKGKSSLFLSLSLLPRNRPLHLHAKKHRCGGLIHSVPRGFSLFQLPIDFS